MDETIRMNQKIPRTEDPELFEYLSQFSVRGRGYQARKLMLLGLIQLERLHGHTEDTPHQSKPETLAALNNENENVVMGETDLIIKAGVDDLF